MGKDTMMKTDISPQHLRDLAAKVEQGTATNLEVNDAIWKRVGADWAPAWLIDGVLVFLEYGGPRFLTSIDAQIKYLPMPGWYMDIEQYKGMSGDIWYTKFTREQEDDRDEEVVGSSEERIASELSARLRAMAWELENGDA